MLYLLLGYLVSHFDLDLFMCTIFLFIDEVTASNGNRAPRTVKIKKNKLQGGLSTADDAGRNRVGASKTSKGPKIVIHLGARSKQLASSPRSDASSFQEQNLTPSNGSEDVAGPRLNDSLDKQDTAAKSGHEKAAVVDQMRGSKLRGKEGDLIKIRKTGTEVTEVPPKFSGGRFLDATESGSAVGTRSSLGKRSTETAAVRMNTDLPVSRSNTLSSTMNDDNNRTPSLSLALKEPKLLKLKFKNPISDNHSSWAPKEEEKSFVKGQRSKRKRPSPLRGKAPSKGDDDGDAAPLYDDRSMDEIMDANWILQKLGKDAIGKRVEVHQPSDNSWNKGTVTEVFEGTSIVCVALDNGKNKSLELGKQSIRFISQKQKRR